MLNEIKTKIESELELPREQRRFGTGWLAGTGGLAAAIAAVAFIICLKFPNLLTTPELKAVTQTNWFHIAIIALLIHGFFCALLSMILRPDKTLGIATLILVVLGTMLGGLEVRTPGSSPGIFFGLDFFILNLIFLGFIFIPLERLFPHQPEQTVFRIEWREDLFYYLISSMMVQILSYLTFAPSRVIVSHADLSTVQGLIASQPLWLQIIEIMFLTDFVQYWVHRAFHRIPALWRFHSVHHSAQAMDWLAGARMHFFEVVILRAVSATPMLIAGFSETAIQTYVLIVYIYSSILHSNLRIEPKWIAPILATPRFHHWHHGIEKEAIDVNFSIHFPLFDRLFGTHYLPEGKWPAGYGIKGHPVPKGYWKQFLYAFGKK